MGILSGLSKSTEHPSGSKKSKDSTETDPGLGLPCQGDLPFWELHPMDRQATHRSQ